MSKPVLFPIKAFDKSLGAILTFSYSGNQAFKNKVIIKDNETDAVVYSKEQTTFQLKHELAASDLEALSNGKAYNATVQVFDSNNIGSAVSAPVLFYCFTTPSFLISNIVESQIIQSSYLPVSISYSQLENEPINSYKITLYDAGHQELSNSGILYSVPLDSESYTFSGLFDDTSYYIRATGETLHGFQLDTGFIPFSVNYITPSAFYLLELANQYESGSIKIQSNIVIITGESNSSEYLADSYLVLTNDKYATFRDGYVINKDFALSFVGNASTNSVILELVGNDCRIVVTNIKEYEDPMDSSSYATVHALMQVYKGDMVYEICSNSIDYNIAEYYMFIRRVGDLFSIELLG